MRKRTYHWATWDLWKNKETVAHNVFLQFVLSSHFLLLRAVFHSLHTDIFIKKKSDLDFFITVLILKFWKLSSGRPLRLTVMGIRPEAKWLNFQTSVAGNHHSPSLVRSLIAFDSNLSHGIRPWSCPPIRTNYQNMVGKSRQCKRRSWGSNLEVSD